jgi:hypothetical protein
MLIYRAPRAVRVHTALAQSRRRMASYRISIALAAAAVSLGACTYTSSPPSNPIIGFQPQSITLTTVPGGTAKGAVSVVNVVGTELIGLTTTVGPYSGNGANWLSVSLSGGSAPTPLNLSANAAGLGAGSYTATVNVTAGDARPPTSTLTVHLNVVQP